MRFVCAKKHRLGIGPEAKMIHCLFKRWTLAVFDPSLRFYGADDLHHNRVAFHFGRYLCFSFRVGPV